MPNLSLHHFNTFGICSSYQSFCSNPNTLATRFPLSFFPLPVLCPSPDFKLSLPKAKLNNAAACVVTPHSAHACTVAGRERDYTRMPSVDRSAMLGNRRSLLTRSGHQPCAFVKLTWAADQSLSALCATPVLDGGRPDHMGAGAELHGSWAGLHGS